MRTVTARTFDALLADRLRTDPGRPLVTAYDGETGERTELSVTTYANWVSKTANLFTEELDLVAGSTVLLDLPAHWLVPVFLGAAWTAGVSATTEADVPHDLHVCGPDLPVQPAAPVLACALLPFAVRFPEPLPGEVLDYGLLWPGQSDLFLSSGPVGPDTTAWRSGGDAVGQADLIDRATGRWEDGVRLLTDAHPATEGGVPAFLAPLVAEGSVVLQLHPTAASWSARESDERATAVWRTGQPAVE